MIGREIVVGIVGAVATLAMWGYGELRVRAAEAETHQATVRWEQEKTRHVSTIAAYERSAREAADKHRATERAWSDKVQEAQHVLQRETAAHARTAAGLRAERDQLRRDIASYAAGTGAAEDTLAACRDRAATLGDVLGEALRADGESAAAAEDHAAGVRALLAAWPVNPGAP